MTGKLNILLIAPNAPPKNTPEAIQVRRILAELDTATSGRLVTVIANTAGTWSRNDATLQLPLKHYDTHILALPFHKILGRLLMSHRLAWLHGRDNLFWIQWMAGRVIGALPKKPDIIYSRSYPMSAARLAYKLKQKLHIQWVMHLSDPWADNPYKKFNARDAAYEAECFKYADVITLTTQGQVEYYQRKYPELAKKITVSPNVMAEDKVITLPPMFDQKLHIIFAGALYGIRSPAPLLAALDIVRATRPDILTQLKIDFYGNAQEEALRLLQSASDIISYHGAVPFAEAYGAQQAADIVLTIEPETGDVFSNSFLPSKVIDCLALQKKILAITPEGSETAKICAEGYGWAIAPSQTEQIATQIITLVENVQQIRNTPPMMPPERYRAKKVVEDLILRMNSLL